MLRTTVMLPSNLKNKAQAFASKKGISVGELIRESLEIALLQAKGALCMDPFFEDTHFFTGDIPNDLSANHDKFFHSIVTLPRPVLQGYRKWERIRMRTS